MVEETMALSLGCRPIAECAPRARSQSEAAALAAARMRRYAELTGLTLVCVDARTGAVIAATDGDDLGLLPAAVQNALPVVREPRVLILSGGFSAALFPLPEIDGAPTVAVGYAFDEPGCATADLVLAAAERNWPQTRLAEWRARQLICRPEALEKLVTLAVRLEEQERRATQHDLEFAQLGDQLEQTYEEVSLMRALTRRLQISRGSGELAELCLLRLHELVGSAGNAIWIAGKDSSRTFHVQGELPFDEIGMARLISHFDEHDWTRPLVRNNLSGGVLAADFPGLRNVIVMPICEGVHRFGWIVSCNLSGDREFGTIEAGLINSVAAILGTHLRNIELYREHEELLLSFVRSLVSTLDAKDPYTRGHSERVALVAKRLGEELGLPEDELRDLYLAGLLHDIGKIGVDDGILRKSEKLTDEEFRQIREHPMIGYSILNGLKNLQQILPGVRNHHESYQGGGYPDGLVGENIPLMARILAVADSYDAMKSNRPYREGLSRKTLEEVFHKGAGFQWDRRVISAYFRAAEDVSRISDTYITVADRANPAI